MPIKQCQHRRLVVQSFTMQQYFFILGRNPELSAAELHALLPEGYKILACSKQTLVVECKDLEVESLMRRLGGTIKMGLVEMRNAESGTPNAVLSFIASSPKEQKVFFGLSAYALEDKVKLPTARQLRQLGIEIKRALQKKGYKVRLVTSQDIALSSVIVKKEKLLTHGAEIVLLYGCGSTPGAAPEVEPRYIGKTLAVQEFEQASLRDFGRPAREMQVGMLPIQLAKIMINLARAPQGATLLDPFCGLGTVLTEAWLMGYRALIGTDLEQNMIASTQKNFQWLIQQNTPFSNSRQRRTGALASLGMELENVKLLTTPVEELSRHLQPRSVDAIVTEPYLGPTRHGTWNIEHGTKELIELYIAAFREFAKILKPGGRVVFIFPAFKQKLSFGLHPRQKLSFEQPNDLLKTSDHVLPEIKKLGFQPIPLLPKPYPLDPSPSLIYSRPDQRVLREIFMLKYNI